jgi:hypothetical protein
MSFFDVPFGKARPLRDDIALFCLDAQFLEKPRDEIRATQ